MVNLTTLAPDIVTAIPDETLPPDLTLFDLAVDPPALWEEQRDANLAVGPTGDQCKLGTESCVRGAR